MTVKSLSFAKRRAFLLIFNLVLMLNTIKNKVFTKFAQFFTKFAIIGIIFSLTVF